MFSEFKKEVEEVLRDALKRASCEYQELELVESEHADISSRLPFYLSHFYKKLKSPNVIAEGIVRNMKIPSPSKGLISKAVASGPYINFYVNTLFLHKTLKRIKEEGADFGCLHKKAKVIVEHTSANPDGPLHIGHLRNAIIGDSITRLLKKTGYEVETQYYINDMGKQVAILVWGVDKFGFDGNKKEDHAVADVYIAANRLIEGNEEYAKQIEELMRKYEAEDEEVVRKYEVVVKKCISGIKASLHAVNIQHDLFIWESEFIRDNSVQEITEEIKKSGNAKFNGNALLLQLEGIEKALVIQRSDGTSLYTTRDIAYHRGKSSRCDRMINILGKDHELVSLQLEKALQMLKIRNPEVVIFEFVSLPDGDMSTRAGKYISADELIQKIGVKAYEEVDKRRRDLPEDKKKEIARKVSIGALRYDFVKVSPDKMMLFDLEYALDIEKKGAPFIQYAHARACSILKMAEERSFLRNIDEYDASLLREESEIDLIKMLSKLEYVIEKASSSLKPHILAKYGRELAESFNKFYKDCPVLNAEDETRKARLNLVICAKTTLSITLNVLGIETPEEM